MSALRSLGADDSRSLEASAPQRDKSRDEEDHIHGIRLNLSRDARRLMRKKPGVKLEFRDERALSSEEGASSLIARHEGMRSYKLVNLRSYYIPARLATTLDDSGMQRFGEDWCWSFSLLSQAAVPLPLCSSGSIAPKVNSRPSAEAGLEEAARSLQAFDAAERPGEIPTSNPWRAQIVHGRRRC